MYIQSHTSVVDKLKHCIAIRNKLCLLWHNINIDKHVLLKKDVSNCNVCNVLIAYNIVLRKFIKFDIRVYASFHKSRGTLSKM